MEAKKRVGKQTVQLEFPPVILGYSSIVGKKEGEGPLGCYFDLIEEDELVGEKNWEQAESKLQKQAVQVALSKAGLKSEEIDYLVAGDLLGQLIATSFGVIDLNIPMFGVYGACSTMGEALSIGSILIDGGFANRVVSLTSSHFAGAEKQFRFPLDYGNQRPLCATWTVTGSGAVILGDHKQKEQIQSKEVPLFVTKITTGKVTDYGVKDSMNMGACMAPAAADVIGQNLIDLGVQPDYYDKIVTGDLGIVGARILKDLMKERGYNINKQHMDCGIEIFDPQEQDTHAGGSGCGCSAVTLTGYIFRKMKKREWKRILFVPTGALLSTVSFNEGNSVPGIAHGVVIES